MPLKKKKEVTTYSYHRSKDQGGASSSKEMEYEEDISEVNVSNYAFYEKFEDEKMSIQFIHLFWTRTTTKA